MSGVPALDPEDAEMVADELRALGWQVEAPGDVDPLRVEVRAILAEWQTEFGVHIEGGTTGLISAFATTLARLAHALGEPMPPPNLPPVPPATDPSWLVERDDGEGFEILGRGRDE